MFKYAMLKVWLSAVGAVSAASSPPPKINAPSSVGTEVRVAQAAAGAASDAKASATVPPAGTKPRTQPPANRAAPTKSGVAKPAATGGAPGQPVSTGIAQVATGKAATPPAKLNASDTLSLTEVVGRVQKHYDGAQSYQARFEQAQLNATFGRTTRSTGEVLFKKPGRMRWNYTAPEKKMFVSNGDVLWLFEPDDKQAFRQDLKGSQLPAALAFLMGKGKLADEFNIEFAPKLTYGRPADYRLSLKPKQVQSSYKAIYFIVDPETFHVRQTVLVDSQGNINDVTFNDMQVNAKVADSSFQWKPPAGTRVIDASKARP